MEYSIRKARLDDCDKIETLIALSARRLSLRDYSPEQIEGALQGALGVDTQLIKDETYFVTEVNGKMVGCGGWSKRRTLFGGDKRGSRDYSELNPENEPAKIRAFFVHPEWTRKGIGRAILEQCESEARLSGFHSLELISTLPGAKFYSACGYTGDKEINYKLPTGNSNTFLPMKKVLGIWPASNN